MGFLQRVVRALWRTSAHNAILVHASYLEILFGFKILQKNLSTVPSEIHKPWRKEQWDKLLCIKMFTIRFIFVKYGYKDVFFEKRWNLKLFDLEIRKFPRGKLVKFLLVKNEECCLCLMSVIKHWPSKPSPHNIYLQACHSLPLLSKCKIWQSVIDTWVTWWEKAGNALTWFA